MLTECGLALIAIFVILQHVDGNDNFHYGAGKQEAVMWRRYKTAVKGQRWYDSRRLKGQRMIRYMIFDRNGQAFLEMNKNGTEPDCWVQDGPVKMLIHTFSNNLHAAEPMLIIREQKILDIAIAYTKKNEKLNVIVVDWTPLAVESTNQYVDVVKNVPYAAESIANFLQNLYTSDNIKDWKEVHLVGLGVGAHVGGTVGKAIMEKDDGHKLGRISGLDPQGVRFVDNDGERYKRENESLTMEDAEFVDIIHCNMGEAKDIMEAAVKGRFGSVIQAGHADFYPNGGGQQKDCTKKDETVALACSQRKCAQYYSDSISKKFLACPCDDYEFYRDGNCECDEEDGGVLMGDHTNFESPPSGMYYLDIPEKQSMKDPKKKKNKEDPGKKKEEDSEKKKEKEPEKKEEDESDKKKEEPEKTEEGPEKKKEEDPEKKTEEEPVKKTEGYSEKKNEEKPKKNTEEDPEKKNEEETEKKTEEEPEKKKEDPEKKTEEEPEKTEGDSEKKVEEDPEKKNEEEPEKKNEEEPEKRTEGEPEKKTEEEPETKTEEEPEKKTEEEPETKTEEEPEKKTEEDLEKKAEEDPEKKKEEEPEKNTEADSEETSKEDDERKK